MLDHSQNHNKNKRNGLNAKKMNAGFVCSQPKMRNTKLEDKDCLGLYPNTVEAFYNAKRPPSELGSKDDSSNTISNPLPAMSTTASTITPMVNSSSNTSASIFTSATSTNTSLDGSIDLLANYLGEWPSEEKALKLGGRRGPNEGAGPIGGSRG